MARRRRPEPSGQQADWNFRSFPTFFGFACGALTATLLLLLTGGALVFVVWLVSLFGVSFGVAHIIGHTLRRRGLDRAIEHEEEMERERRALAARDAAALEGESHSIRRRRRRRT